MSDQRFSFRSFLTATEMGGGSRGALCSLYSLNLARVALRHSIEARSPTFAGVVGDEGGEGEMRERTPRHRHGQCPASAGCSHLAPVSTRRCNPPAHGYSPAAVIAQTERHSPSARGDNDCFRVLLLALQPRRCCKKSRNERPRGGPLASGRTEVEMLGPEGSGEVFSVVEPIKAKPS